MDFNGSNQYLSETFSTDWNPGSGDFTLSMWLYSPVNAVQSVFSSIESGEKNGIWFAIAGSGTTPALWISDATSAEFHNFGAGNFTVGSLHHYLIRRLSSTMYFFKDGVSVYTPTSSTEVITDSTEPTTIGKRSTGPTYYYDGDIFDLRYYNRGLSDAEIKIIVESKGADRITNGLNLRLRMTEETTGSTSTTDVNDVSPNGGHAFTPSNSPLFQAQPTRNN